MNRSRAFQREQNTKLLQDFQTLTALAPKNGNNAKVQMSRDGNSVIRTRHNSALARFVARVFTKLSPIDFYDKFSIANPQRQIQAADKFREILKDKCIQLTDELLHVESLSLNNLRIILEGCHFDLSEVSAEDLLKKMFSISNFDENEIASGNITEDLKNFAGIDVDQLSRIGKNNAHYIYNSVKACVESGFQPYGFSNNEIGYVLASALEEAKPMFMKCNDENEHTIYSDYYNSLSRLEKDLEIFVNKHSAKPGDNNGYGTDVLNSTADEALKLMKNFSDFSDILRGTGPGEDTQPGFAKIALLPVFRVSRNIFDDGEAMAKIAAGGETALVALEKFSSQQSNALNPQLERLASFEPLLAVLNLSGLMRSANNSYKLDVESGKINAANVQEAWNKTATEFIQQHATQT